MSSINFSGLASGLDTNAIISALVGVQRIPIQRLQVKQSNIDVRISKMGDLKSKLEELKKAAEAISTPSDILAYSATNSDEKVVGVSLSSGALPGSFDVTVNNLAKAEKNRSSAFLSSGEQVKAGTLSIAVGGGTAKDVAITEGMTLRDVADAINAADAGVQASIVSDGTSSFLQVAAKSTGYSTAVADDEVVLTESYTGTAGQELALTQFQAAENAELVVDQLTITSKSNTISTAVEGVSFELKQEGTATISVDSDRAKTKENIQAFVDKYNDVISFLQSELRVGEGETRDRKLAGDPAVRSLKQKFSSFVSGFVPGTSGLFDSLSQLGIKTDAAGKLAVDESDLNDALDKDPFGVAEIFLKENNGIIDQVTTLVEQYTDPIDGILGQRTKALEATNSRYDDQIATIEDRITQYQERLRRQFTAMEAAISSFNAQAGQLAGLASLSAPSSGSSIGT